MGAGPQRDGATTGCVHFGQAVVNEDPARREVRAWHVLHQLKNGWFRPALCQDKFNSVSDLGEIVWRHRGCHANSDAAGAVHQQVGKQARKTLGLGRVAVVRWCELDRLFVKLAEHGHGCWRESTLGVPVRRWGLVQAAEVPLRIDQRDVAREVLAHTDEGVVDGTIAVWVVFTNGVTNDSSALAVRAIGANAHTEHGVQDAALDRLEAITDVGNRSACNNRKRVREEGFRHLVSDRNVDDFSREVSLHRQLVLGHQLSIALPYDSLGERRKFFAITVNCEGGVAARLRGTGRSGGSSP